MKFFGKISKLNVITCLFNTDYEILKKIPKDVEVEIIITKKRNYEFHKKAMALFNLGYENQNINKKHINNFDHYRRYISIKAGFYIAYELDKGTYYEAKSISFSKMDDLEFSEFYEAIITELCKQLDISKETIKNELLNFM